MIDVNMILKTVEVLVLTDFSRTCIRCGHEKNFSYVVVDWKIKKKSSYWKYHQLLIIPYQRMITSFLLCSIDIKEASHIGTDHLIKEIAIPPNHIITYVNTYFLPSRSPNCRKSSRKIVFNSSLIIAEC